MENILTSPIKVIYTGLGMEVSMVSKGKRSRREKVFAIIMPLAIVCALSYGIYSAADSTKKAQKNNIVNLNDTDDGNVAIKTEDVTDSADNNEDVVHEQAADVKADVSKNNESGSVDTEDKADEAADVAAGNEAVSGINYNSDISNDIGPHDNTSINSAVSSDNSVNDSQDIAQGYTFNEADGLLWPVSGDIILKYSMDSTIYFPTLGVYKCNPAISIKAEKGTNVGVAASGVVKNVSINEETGTTVDIAIGDGYVTTYGLLDNIVVKAGDKVTKGQLLGTVSQPTAYYTTEGANLYFKVTKDGESVDPVELFEE